MSNSISGSNSAGAYQPPSAFGLETGVNGASSASTSSTASPTQDYVQPSSSSSQSTGSANSQIEKVLLQMLMLIEESLKDLLGGTSAGGNSTGGSGAGLPTDSLAGSKGSSGSGASSASSVSPSGSSNGASGGGQLGSNMPSGLQALQPDIENASKATGVPANVLAGQIWQESRAQNAPGGGYMQVIPADANGNDLSTAQGNIMAGAEYDKTMMDKFGSVPLMLRGFNSGPGSVNPNDPNQTTTGLGDSTYVQKVMGFAQDIANGTALPA